MGHLSPECRADMRAASHCNDNAIIYFLAAELLRHMPSHSTASLRTVNFSSRSKGRTSRLKLRLFDDDERPYRAAVNGFIYDMPVTPLIY